jgi:hypothetical protein
LHRLLMTLQEINVQEFKSITSTGMSIVDNSPLFGEEYEWARRHPEWLESQILMNMQKSGYDKEYIKMAVGFKWLINAIRKMMKEEKVIFKKAPPGIQ